MGHVNFDERPMLVFWETTKACLLECKHCRAEAIHTPMENELTNKEAFDFVRSLLSFGRPYPVLIMTGGDVLMRPDVFPIVEYARSLGIPVGLAPSVTPRLTDDSIVRMKELGVKVVSISLDGSTPQTHEGIRGIAGHFDQTVDALRRLVEAGFEVQVNTAVMSDNAAELPALAQLLKETGVHIWEVFFLIHVGRGKQSHELPPAQCEDVCNFLYDASKYDITVRTVEAPFFRRVVAARKAAEHHLDTEASNLANTTEFPSFPLGDLYSQLSTELCERLGAPTSVPRAQTSGTRDGKGIIFVAHDGTVYPAGFLPVTLGNIRETPLPDIYRENVVLRDIREGHFEGKCGSCEYRDACGGSRSRAFANTGNPLSSDPACDYQPAS
ncbi:TIGR04053 family radical SAM/SPASM domain-containing protein [Alicyclobacillus mengziensis]|uniref:TIGR04053 family radical SAM/SPASM domain-containing protein n=1 Tax=Alicyclobacillus mengziensis TaxID=2931921 RepID=A0A9X7VXF6_9BACL|nr:TIGR04053 family radical SAM/SPASM domain-containing protein [Alicyclobacillus mengziensis]QSO46856.1 TIGR04053 family radical SAM/SPASM domain-containing protein [Alicyclobacillus mengziensis]